MFRNINSDLLHWKNKTNRKPLVLNGARQVGKTYSIKEFAIKHYKNHVYFNLETNTRVNKFFDENLDPKNIIQFLEVVANQKISHDDTLIIWDEIQACPRALLALKSFCEDAPQYHVIAAGSLLGVAVHRNDFSYPVGKIDELKLFPFDFKEFLLAINKDFLLQEIIKAYRQSTPLSDALHQEALSAFYKYLIIGGMPAAINAFLADNNSFIDVQNVQQQIINDYTADMAKYASPSIAIKIRACFDSIPVQLAKDNKKFQYKLVQRGGTATIFGEALDWLKYAGLVHACYLVHNASVPLAAYVDMSNFKIFMADTGLLVMKSNMPLETILSDYQTENIYLGAIAENYVAQALSTNKHKLYYWKNNNTAELDFMIQKEGQIIPIEVKKGKRTRSTSFNIFLKQYNSSYGIRISSKNFGFDNHIKSVPLYAAWLI